MEPTTQETTASGMFGGGQQDDTIVVANTEQGIIASGMFGSDQQNDIVIPFVADGSIVQESLVVTTDSLPIGSIPAPTFVTSFQDEISEQQLDDTLEQIAPIVIEQVPVQISIIDPVKPLPELAPTSLTIMTVNQEEQQIQSLQVPTTGSISKGIESLKQAPEFAGIDIDAIIAHTNPTGVGATIINTATITQIPTSSAFKKMAAIGGGLFVLAGAGVYVYSTMFSATTDISSSIIQADVQQTQQVISTGLTVVVSGDAASTNSIPTGKVNQTITEVSTTNQPSFGAVPTDSGTDLIGQVGEPGNALVDTAGHITSLKEKIIIAQTTVQNATVAGRDDAIKYGNFAIAKYKEIVQKLENGGYSSNKDVIDAISKIDLFYNKAIDIMNK